MTRKDLAHEDCAACLAEAHPKGERRLVHPRGRLMRRPAPKRTPSTIIATMRRACAISPSLAGAATLMPASNNSRAFTPVRIVRAATEQLDGYLSGAGVVLSNEVLDRIDEIVPPGIDVAPLEGAVHVPPAISELALRRRPAEARSAA